MNDNKIKKIDNSNEFHFNNNIQVGKTSTSFNKNNNSIVEEMDLEVTENKQEININKEDVQSAIFGNFENNRRITNEMQQKVYERVNEKINALLRNDGEI